MRRGRRRGKMATEGPTYPPPTLVPLLMSVVAVLISHHIFNAAAQIPDPEVRAGYTEFYGLLFMVALY